MPADSLDQIVALCQRRAFVHPTGEIYGGLAASYDLGHYGTQLKGRLRDAWWHSMLREHDDVISLDSAIIQHPTTWEASGHLALFSDPVVHCSGCSARLRADHVADGTEPCRRRPSRVAGTTSTCSLSAPEQCNLMFSTRLGGAGQEAWLRPETAQGIFTNFEQVLKNTRMRPPFGVAQVGKSFRNEITARQFTFRTREFEQCEMEWFCHPSEATSWYEHWRAVRRAWYASIGFNDARIRLREHGEDERAHYSVGTVDVEYHYPFGWGEVEGIAHRGEHDLAAHMRASGRDLRVRRDGDDDAWIPNVIEPAMGLDRLMLAVLCEAYDTDEIGTGQRTVLRLPARLAPVTAAVLPLVNKDGMPETAQGVYRALRGEFACEYDAKGAIGRRYRRQDEIGTPFCLTVDGDTAIDGRVTIRLRDDGRQERVGIDTLHDWLASALRVR